MNTYRRVYAKINLDAVRRNVAQIQTLLRPDTRMIAVVKANGYGHGAQQVADAIEPLDVVYGFAVATAEEALELRAHGILKPILILGYVFAEHYPMLVAQKIRPAVFTLEAAKQLSAAAQAVGEAKKARSRLRRSRRCRT